jgi:hypothetical protein
MSKTDDLLGPGFAWRLRAALDRVQPPQNAPSYLSVTPRGALRTVFLRAAPAVAVGVAGLMLTAYAATGSPNPVIWTQNAASAITSITHAPEPVPTAEPSSAPVQEPVRIQSQPPAEQEPAEAKSEPSKEGSKEPEKPESERSGTPSDDR